MDYRIRSELRQPEISRHARTPVGESRLIPHHKGSAKRCRDSTNGLAPSTARTELSHRPKTMPYPECFGCSRFHLTYSADSIDIEDNSKRYHADFSHFAEGRRYL